MLNTKEDILKNQIVLVPIRERNTMEVKGDPSTVWLQAFFKISSFMFNIKKKLIQVWNDIGMSKFWQNVHINCNLILQLHVN